MHPYPDYYYDLFAQKPQRRPELLNRLHSMGWLRSTSPHDMSRVLANYGTWEIHALYSHSYIINFVSAQGRHFIEQAEDDQLVVLAMVLKLYDNLEEEIQGKVHRPYFEWEL